MAGSAEAGPIVIHGGRSGNVSVVTPNMNPDAGPSAIAWGCGFMDPRVGYNMTRRGWIGIGASDYVRILQQVPSALANNNIAAAAATVSGTAMTLVAASGAGVTVLAAALTVWASGSVFPVGTLALDGAPGLVSYGQADPAGLKKNNIYDATKALTRATSITGNAGAVGGNFIVKGADLYGYTQTEQITHAGGATTANGKKAFKFITSVTPQFTDAGHTYSVGTQDVFGFPLLATLWDNVDVVWNNANITANTGFTVADQTNPATSTTGDVRGTYGVQSASDGTKRLTMSVAVPDSTIATLAGWFGVTPA